MPRRAKTAAVAVVAAGALAIGATAVATGSHSDYAPAMRARTGRFAA